ncbi:MAG: DUF1638 domain-containing protein [Acidimicrobiia bacterium]
MERPERRLLVIGCGAMARELLEVVRRNGLEGVDVTCLPARYHNTPQLIAEAVEERIRSADATYDEVFVAYGDCGTGGRLDRVLERHGVERLEGAHCYEFLAGSAVFNELHDSQPATFYLTDFLVRHFDRLVWKGLGLDRWPQLLPDYFGNYERVVYLAQTDDPTLTRRAEEAAQRLGLAFEVRRVGYGELEPALTLRARPA